MRGCSICLNPQRARIDTCLVSGGTVRDIAAEFLVSRSAVDRHRQHIPKALVLAKQALEITHATTLLSRVEALMSRVEHIASQAIAQKQWAGAVAASRELRCCLELLGKLSGELQPAGTKIAIDMRDIKKIDLRELSDEQLQHLMARLDLKSPDEKAAVGTQLGIAPVFNVSFVKPGE